MAASLFGSRSRRPRDPRGFCLDVLRTVGLDMHCDTPAHSLTLALQKRLEFARAICTGAHVILLDEIMAGLTPTEIRELVGIVRYIHERHNLTLLVIEHVMGVLMDLSDRIVVLHHGKTIAIGTPAAIAKDSSVLRIYFGEEH